MGATEEADARPAGYATGRATKDSIVASAVDVFGQRGFYGTSLRGIAREAGVDHSTLIHHFRNKTTLLLAVIEWHDAQNMPTALPDDITPEFIVEGIVTTARRSLESPGFVQLLSMLSAEAHTEGHPARESLQQRHEMLRTVISWTIRRQRNDGAAPDDGMTPDQRAAHIIATWDGMQLYNGLHPGELDVPEVLAGMLREAFGIA